MRGISLLLINEDVEKKFEGVKKKLLFLNDYSLKVDINLLYAIYVTL